jgi:hypothetical protein
MVGGMIDGFNVRDVYLLDPLNQKIIDLPPMTRARRSSYVFTYEGVLYAASNCTLEKRHEYTQTWSLVTPPCPTNRGECKVALCGHLVIFAGGDHNPHSLVAFNLKTHKWLGKKQKLKISQNINNMVLIKIE